MHDNPDPGDLLDMVADVLRTTIMPQLDFPGAYQARIAANVVAIVARQWRQGSADDAAELTRLRGLLDHDGDLAALNHVLAEQLRDGRASLEHPDVASHLWTTSLAKLAVDQPRYARYRQVTEEKIE